MREVHSSNPDRLALRSRKSGFAIVFGLVFVTLGAGACFVNIDEVDRFFRNPNGTSIIDFDADSVPPWTLQAVSAGLLFFGVVFLAFRDGVWIDRDTGQPNTARSNTGKVVQWFGLGVPMLKRTTRMTPHTVRIRRETHRYRGHVHTSNPITLLGRGKYVNLCQPDDAVRAWALAQLIANFLGAQLVDESVDACGQLATIG